MTSLCFDSRVCCRMTGPKAAAVAHGIGLELDRGNIRTALEDKRKERSGDAGSTVDNQDQDNQAVEVFDLENSVEGGVAVVE